MSEQPEHPGYAPWKAPTETYLDQDGQQDRRDLRPDFFLRCPTIPPLPPTGYRRPRQCLIEDDDAISFGVARKILEQRWNASTAEILLWLNSEPRESKRLHVFSSHHAIGFTAFGRRFYWRQPGGEGCVRPCVGLGSQDEPGDCPDAERLSYYLFSRAEVEAFDPALNEDDSDAEIEYYVSGCFNPSGRYLSFDQAVDFLCRDEPNRDIVVGVIHREFQRCALIALKPCASWLIPLVSDCLNFVPNARPEDGHFFEGQVVGLAKEEFGADIQRWDTASRPDRFGDAIRPLERRDTSNEQSDISLGRYRRAQLQGFAERNEERCNEREQEWARWQAKAAEIQAGRMRPASYRELAQLVKTALNLPDSIETIRKKISPTG